MAVFRKNLGISSKHLQIDKANQLTLVAAAITTAVVIFSLVAAQALVKQLSYQNKVISLKSKANKQLVTNVAAAKELDKSYQTFENLPESVIGTKDKNSKIVLDSLPSKYDFPALATSLEGLIKLSSMKIATISGTDDEASAEQNSASPTPVKIPFQISATGNFTNAQKLLVNLERSIRPMKVSEVTFSGSDASLQVSVNADTYYQPEKKLEVKETVVTNGKTTVKKTTATTGSSTK